MITNDVELRFVEEQLQLVTEALASFRAAVEPKNPRNFQIMSGSYVDLQQSLQADIDDYLARRDGVATNGHAPRIAPQQEVGDRLLAALAGLEPRDREIVQLRIQGVPDAEIANRLDIPMYRLSTRLQEIRQTLGEVVLGEVPAGAN